MQSVGLSMALGAFLAGVLLAEAVPPQLEPTSAPSGPAAGLFFIAVGMSIDFAVMLPQPLRTPGIVAGFLLVKAAVLWVMGRAMPIPAREPSDPCWLGGEFGFVLFQTAAGPA